MADEPPILVVPDVAAWRAWLDDNEDSSDGVWLTVARKGTLTPTSLSYDQALREALCSGWIDGQVRSNDAATFRQRFTPRRRRSIWSLRNTGIVAELIAQGRMRPRGHSEIEAAKADGRWDRAYAGSSTIEVPDDLAGALSADPGAEALFAKLTSQNRYAVLHRIVTAPNPETRQRRLEKLVGGLARGETPYPQRFPDETR
jgi:uncharacterized protein YdeI (YjbR/CyaY-like superfamily)